jgi:hypothetical protein
VEREVEEENEEAECDIYVTLHPFKPTYSTISLLREFCLGL